MNLAKVIKQAATMQKEMERVQAELAARTVDFSSGGGMVTATARGAGTLARIKIDPKVINPADAELLEDLVVSAVDGALRQAKDLATQELGKVTAGLKLPGMF